MVLRFFVHTIIDAQFMHCLSLCLEGEWAVSSAKHIILIGGQKHLRLPIKGTAQGIYHDEVSSNTNAKRKYEFR